jgi:hypothetical protein
MQITTDKGRDAGNVAALSKGHQQHANGTSAAPADQDFKRIQDAAAQRGVRIEPIERDDGGMSYAVSRWSMTRVFETAAELVAFLRRMGVV